MDTLYDLLGALPRDDADGLRTAFRKAVKGAHPDLRPGDPDAAIKFRQIVRANEILADPEQRAAYDHLLTLAQIEKKRALVHPIAAKVHKVASGIMALTSASLVTVGGYLVFMHMPISMALPAPSGHTASARNSETNTDLRSRVSASIAALSPAVMPDPAAVNAFIVKSTAPSEPAPRPVITVANLDPLPTEGEIAHEPVTITLPEVAAAYVSPFRAERVAVSYSGDRDAASAGLDQAIQLDPKLLISYAEQGIPFYAVVKSDHAFGEVAPVKRAGKPGHARVALAASSNPPTEAEALPKAVPLPRPRGPLHVFRPPAAWYASVFQ
jgi:DnaJ domain